MFYKNNGPHIAQVSTIGVTDLGRLSADSLRDVTMMGARMGDPGTTEDNGIVPFVCRKGVTLVDIDDAREDLVSRAKSAFAKHERLTKLQREAAEKHNTI